jgi:ABC-2 type transport system permease protein
VFTTVGLLLRSPSAVLNGGFPVLFPVTFVSTVFVDPATLPSALRAVVEVNPVPVLATVTRGLLDGVAEPGQVGVVLAVATALTLVFAPLTTRPYRRA